MTDPQTTASLQLGDRVRVNETCECQELIGNFGFVVGMTMRPDLTVNVWLSDTWPPKQVSSDNWDISDFDKVQP